MSRTIAAPSKEPTKESDASGAIILKLSERKSKNGKELIAIYAVLDRDIKNRWGA